MTNGFHPELKQKKDFVLILDELADACSSQLLHSQLPSSARLPDVRIVNTSH